jgi:beta-galactosidase
MAVSSYINGKFLPDVTSYDYDAPLDESGRPTPKYFAYRKLLAKWSTCGNESCLPPVPPTAPTISIPAIAFTEAAPLWQHLPKPVASALPVPMEKLEQNYGYILYRTQLPERMHGDLQVRDIHDFASVYVDGKLVGTMDRRDAAPDGSLPGVPVSTNGPARLDILVANDGRVNVDHTMRTENKGITQLAVLDGRPLGDWRIYTLPMDALPTSFSANAASSPKAPTFFRAHFNLASTGDTFLDTRNLGKGAIWINGHNLGRFWNGGPQDTLYVPGPWLHAGRNDIVVFDQLPSTHESVAGLDHPILDGPVRDKSTSNQE